MISSTGSAAVVQRGALQLSTSSPTVSSKATRSSSTDSNGNKIHFSRRSPSQPKTPTATATSSSSTGNNTDKKKQSPVTKHQRTSSTGSGKNNVGASKNPLPAKNQPSTSTTKSVIAQQQQQQDSSSSLSSNANNNNGIEERTAKQVILPKDPHGKKMAKLFRGMKLYYSSFPRDCIENIARSELGMSRSPNMEKADIIWIEHNPLTNDGLRLIDPEFQRVNCWVGMKNLATKCEFGMVMNLARSVIDPLYPSIYSYLPRTFVLPQDKDALLEFIAANSKSKKNKKSAAAAIAGRRGVQKWKQISKTGTVNKDDLMSVRQESTTTSTFYDDDDQETSLDRNSSADSDLHRFYLEQGAKNSDPVWVVKPDAGCGGDGIFLCSDLQNIPIHQNCVVQEYIPNPLLLNGIKFDLRVYVLVTSLCPLRFYVHREGLARFAVEKYEYPSKKNFHKLNMHLTNYSLNKWNDKFVENVNEDHDEYCSKRTISTAFAQLEEEYGSEHFDAEEVWDNIGIVAETTLFSFSPFLLLGADIENASAPNANAPMPCFQIIGIDILLDSAMQPHLLEVNHHPSLLTDAPVDAIVKGLLARHTLRMVAHPWAYEHRRRLLPMKKKASNKKNAVGGKKIASPAVAVDKNRPWRSGMAKKDDSSNDDDESSSSDDEEEEEEEEEADQQPVEKNTTAASAPPAAATSRDPSKPPLSSVATAVLAATKNIADPEKKETTACRAQYENGANDPDDDEFDGRTVPESQAEWEYQVRGPLFDAWQPESASRPIFKFAVQPFLRLRDIFVACCGGALSRNKSVDSMNGTRFSRFARKYGVATTKSINEIDLMFLRHTRERGVATLRFTDFVWLLLIELGPSLVPGSVDGSVASHERLTAVVDFLDAHETNLADATSTNSKK